MYYTIYKITNQIDGKIYIGSHKTKDLNDNYMGSGKYLKYAQDKHGIENFDKEIMFVFGSADLMYRKEAELVNEEFISGHNTYNIKKGGFGGWDYLNDEDKFSNPTHASDHMIMMSRCAFDKHPMGSTYGKKRSEATKTKISESLIAINHKGFLGKSHTEDRKRQIGDANSILQSGDKNSQFGSMWITDGIRNKKIKKTDAIPDGWKKGRILKHLI